MKQVIIVADLNRWGQEADLLGDMLRLTATCVTTMNIGSGKVIADLQAEELLKLFPGKTLAESVHLALAKLYRQSIIDGILTLVGDEQAHYNLLDKAFSALPFGLPKIAVVGSNCKWQRSRDIFSISLPGTEYSLNPAIKILLGNAAFALSGMSLGSIDNFSCRAPTVGVYSLKTKIGSYLREAGLGYICFTKEDQLLGTLIKDGYIQGLIISTDNSSYRFYLGLGARHQVPTVLICPDCEKLAEELDFLPPSFTLTIISPRRGKKTQLTSVAANPSSLADNWRFLFTIYNYGSERFYQSAVRVLSDQLASTGKDLR